MAFGNGGEGISIQISADLSLLQQGLEQSRKAITAFADGPINEVTQNLNQSFGVVGRNIGEALAKAAETGKFSFKDMVTSILRDLQRLAIKKFITDPLMNLVGSFLPGNSFSGGRAFGGPVMANHAYMVGERGPEMFVPSSRGRIVPSGGAAAAPVTVHFHMPAGTDMAAFQRSESQISTMLSKAVARGQRNL